jgi:hypothetical protein
MPGLGLYLGLCLGLKPMLGLGLYLGLCLGLKPMLGLGLSLSLEGGGQRQLYIYFYTILLALNFTYVDKNNNQMFRIKILRDEEGK